jgi:hypothetical protein
MIVVNQKVLFEDSQVRRYCVDAMALNAAVRRAPEKVRLVCAVEYPVYDRET